MDNTTAVSDHSTTANEPTPLLADVLIYVSGEVVAKFAVESGEYIIGRDATCHIVVDAEQVSRHHARLTFNAFELLVEDLGSSNGVFIDGVQVQIPTRIRPNQEVQIGCARLYVRLKAEAERQLREALWDKDLGLESVRRTLDGPKYKTLTTIGRGGMGVVMQARDLRIRRTVAMKVMKSSSQFSRENVLRFMDEAQLTGQLEHPNIVPVYELGLDEQGESFYTMKFVRGITLDEVLRGLRADNPKMTAKYPLGTLLTIFQKICDGVAYAHAKGVVHRDLKPENVMIGDFGEVLVMDWGLAKNMTGAQRGSETPGNGKTPEPHVETFAEQEHMKDARGFETMHGLVVGTPPYISPEQARGELDQIDPRSDIFVLGGILYAILALRAPVAGSTVPEILENILASRVTPPSTFSSPPKSGRRSAVADPDAVPLPHLPGGRVPDSLSAVVMKAMSPEPEQRYQTVEDLQADITAYQGGFATKAERASLGKHILLWAGRHKKEVTLFITFAVLLQVVIVMAFFSLKHEKDAAIINYNLAIASEERAKASEKREAEARQDLRETAPTFASDAEALIEDLKFDEALAKIDYAIEQQPQNAAFWILKGNALQSLLRFSEAAVAYETAVHLDPKSAPAQTNLDLTQKLLAELGPDKRPTPALLRELQQSLLEQNRVDEAFAVLRELTADRDLFRRTILDAFGKLGLRERVEPNDDLTINLDLSNFDLSKGMFGDRPERPGDRPERPGGPPPKGRRAVISLRELRNRPIVNLNLDNTRVVDLTLIKNWKLQTLSLSGDPVIDLTPLSGMQLRTLNADGCPIRDIAALAGMPLETVRLRNTRINDLKPLVGAPLEQLWLTGCRGVTDLGPLAKLPLQQLDLSRTGISDLTPIVGCPIRELNLEGCNNLTDLHPLMEMKQLEAVLIPSHVKDIDFLREHPSLKRLSYKKLTQSAADFWAQRDE